MLQLWGPNSIRIQREEIRCLERVPSVPSIFYRLWQRTSTLGLQYIYSGCPSGEIEFPTPWAICLDSGWILQYCVYWPARPFYNPARRPWSRDQSTRNLSTTLPKPLPRYSQWHTDSHGSRRHCDSIL